MRPSKIRRRAPRLIIHWATANRGLRARLTIRYVYRRVILAHFGFVRTLPAYKASDYRQSFRIAT